MTRQQQKALHLMFRQLANELNDHGLDARKVLKPEIEIPWNDKMVKELMWRPVQKIMLGKKSTTELENSEVDKVFAVIQRQLNKQFPEVDIQFPSVETIMNELRDKENNK